MGRRKETTEFHRLFCTECGNEGIPVRRRQGAMRETGHLKSLHCIYCNKEVNHVEIIPNSLYQQEDFENDFNRGKWRK